MLIQTEAELSALPEGTQIRVQSGRGTRAWTRVSNGLRSETDVLGVQMFVGYLAEGRVHTVDPERPSVPGDWWAYNRYVYLHMSVSPDGQHRVMEWYRNQWRGVQSRPANFFRPSLRDMVRLAGPPDSLVTPAAALGTLVIELLPAPEQAKPEKPESVEFTVTVTGRATEPPKVSIH
jgi:hypothetical protein